MLLLNTNRKSYMGSPMHVALSHLTLSDLEGQSQSDSDFEALSRKGAVRPYVTINSKSYMGSPVV